MVTSLDFLHSLAGGHHQTQAQTQTPFLNPTLPPGYPTAGYGGLPYGGLAYPGASILPPGLSYPVFPAVSTVCNSSQLVPKLQTLVYYLN